MLSAALAVLSVVGEVLSENDSEYAKRIVGKALRILGGAESDAHKQEKLAAYVAYLARERASAATTAIMARAKHD